MTGFIHSPLFSWFLIQFFGFPEFPSSLKRKYAKKFYDWLYLQSSFSSPFLPQLFGFPKSLSSLKRKHAKKFYDCLYLLPSFISPSLLPQALVFSKALPLFHKENRRRNLATGFFISPIIPFPNPLKISFFPKKTIFKASGG